MFAMRVSGIDPGADTFAFRAQKTMYGSKLIAGRDVTSARVIPPRRASR